MCVCARVCLCACAAAGGEFSGRLALCRQALSRQRLLFLGLHILRRVRHPCRAEWRQRRLQSGCEGERRSDQGGAPGGYVAADCAAQEQDRLQLPVRPLLLLPRILVFVVPPVHPPFRQRSSLDESNRLYARLEFDRIVQRSPICLSVGGSVVGLGRTARGGLSSVWSTAVDVGCSLLFCNFFGQPIGYSTPWKPGVKGRPTR